MRWKKKGHERCNENRQETETEGGYLCSTLSLKLSYLLLKLHFLTEALKELEYKRNPP